jgi:hypothetical protein
MSRTPKHLTKPAGPNYCASARKKSVFLENSPQNRTLVLANKFLGRLAPHSSCPGGAAAPSTYKRTTRTVLGLLSGLGFLLFNRIGMLRGTNGPGG